LSNLLRPWLAPLIRHLIDAPGGFFILFLLLVGIPAALGHLISHIISVKLRRRTEASFHALAERLGFQVKPSAKALKLIRMPPIVEGQYRGHTVRFFSHWVSGDKSGQWMAVAASTRTPENASLQVASNRWFIRQAFKATRLGATWDGTKMVTAWSEPRLQSMRTDDARFDEVFLEYTNDPAWAKDILTPKVRDALLAIREQSGLLIRLRIEAGEVRYSVRGGFTLLGGFNRSDRVDHLVAQMDFVCSLAEQIEASTPRPRAFTANPI
jgi:hypothetical protein